MRVMTAHVEQLIKREKNVVKKFLTSEEISGNISRHSREAGAIAP